MKKLLIILICTCIALVGAKGIMEIFLLRKFEPDLGAGFNDARKSMGIPLVEPGATTSNAALQYIWPTDTAAAKPSHSGKYIKKEDPYTNCEQDDYRYGPNHKWTYTQSVKYNWVTKKVTSCECQGGKYQTVDTCKTILKRLMQNNSL